jgi:hypothetical protein
MADIEIKDVVQAGAFTVNDFLTGEQATAPNLHRKFSGATLKALFDTLYTSTSGFANSTFFYKDSGGTNTGKTAAEVLALLGIDGLSYFDATIGTGGMYANLQDAFSAGKKRVLLVSDLTMDANITTSNIEIYIPYGYTLTCATFYFTGKYNKFIGLNGSYNYNESAQAIITTAILSSTLPLIQNSYIENIEINAAAVANGPNAGRLQECEIRRCKILLPNSGLKYPIGQYSNLYNCWIVGGGTGCYAYASFNGYVNFIECYFSGSFNAVSTSLHPNSNYIDCITTATNFNINIGANGECRNMIGATIVISGNFYNCDNLQQFATLVTPNNPRLFNSKFTCTLEYSGQNTTWYFEKCEIVLSSNINYGIHTFNNCSFTNATARNISVVAYFNNCTFAGNLTWTVAGIKAMNNCRFQAITINADNCIVDNSSVALTSTINGDNNKFSNNVCSGNISISAGSEYNDISHNTLSGTTTFAGTANNNKFLFNDNTGLVTFSATSNYNKVIGNTFAAGYSDLGTDNEWGF